MLTLCSGMLTLGSGMLGPVWHRIKAGFFCQLSTLALGAGIKLFGKKIKAGFYSHSNFLKARRTSVRSFSASF